VVSHIVLFRPKADLTEADRRGMFEALAVAANDIPSVRRFHIGRRITHGRPYEQMMAEHYPFSAVIEFDDLAGLQAYLDHPQHEKLGALFYQLLDAGLVYDYEMDAPPR
jgi:hypothetical protein